jgi:hypothetical protein
MVESPTRVHVVFGDKRDTTSFDNWAEYHTGGSAFYTKLNPSLDDQSGDAATLATIRVGDESRIGGFWYGQAFLRGGTVHFLSSVSMEGGDLVHVGIGAGSGNPGEPRIFTAQNGSLSQSKWYVRGAGNHVVWAETIYSPTLVGITTQLVRASASSFGGGGGGGGGMPLGTLAVLAGLALARMSRRAS